MTNPTLEQRAREILQRVRGSALWVNDDEAIETAVALATEMPTFSHTGVEQAIEACAKDGWVMVPSEPTPKMVAATFNDPEELSDKPESHNTRNLRIWAKMVAAAPGLPDALPLPAQSPDDIAYAGAVQGEAVTLPLPGEGDRE